MAREIDDDASPAFYRLSYTLLVRKKIDIQKLQSRVVKRRLVDLMSLLRRLVCHKRILVVVVVVVLLVMPDARFRVRPPWDSRGLVVVGVITLMLVIGQRGEAAGVAVVAALVMVITRHATDFAEAPMAVVVSKAGVARIRSWWFDRARLVVPALAIPGGVVFIGWERRAVCDVVDSGPRC